MEIKEKNFFKKVWTSIRDFEGYEEFAAGKVTKAIKYLLLLTLIFTIIVSLAYTYKLYATVKDVSRIYRAKYRRSKLKRWNTCS